MTYPHPPSGNLAPPSPAQRGPSVDEGPLRMTSPHSWLPLHDTWMAEAGAGHVPTVDKSLVHKHNAENVFLRRVEAIEDVDQAYAAQFEFAPSHPYFFEHPLDHVPGLALIEAGRQCGLAVAHRFFGVPLEGYAFFIQDLHAHFTMFVELDAPLMGISVVTDARLKRGRLTSMGYTGHYLQHGRSVGTLTGSWSIVPTAVMQRMRTSQRDAK